MTTKADLAKALNLRVSIKYKELKNILESKTERLETVQRIIESAKNEITECTDSDVLESIGSLNKYYLLLINYPVIWLKVLLTFTFWVTLNEIVVSKTVQSLFTSFVAEDTSNLQSKGFVYNKHQYEENMSDEKKIKRLQSIAAFWYDVIRELAKMNISIIEDQIELMVNSANDILGNSVGDRAKAACEASARGTTLFHYIRLMGCLSGLTQESECVQIKQALADLITDTGTQ